jgi:hypothetical protein
MAGLPVGVREPGSFSIELELRRSGSGIRDPQNPRDVAEAPSNEPDQRTWRYRIPRLRSQDLPDREPQIPSPDSLFDTFFPHRHIQRVATAWMSTSSGA